MEKTSYERYAELRNKKGLTDYQVSKLAGIKSTAPISNWKNGKYIPKEDKMIQIASVVGTTSNYILKGINQPEIPDFSDDQLELIELYDKLSDEKKNLALELIKSMK